MCAASASDTPLFRETPDRWVHGRASSRSFFAERGRDSPPSPKVSVVLPTSTQGD